MASSSSHQREKAIILGIGAAALVGIGYGIWYYSKKNKAQRVSSKSDQKLSSNDEKRAINTENLSPLEKAAKAKDNGNECFRTGRYAEAIKFYTEAIDLCPLNTPTSSLSAFYQNRAAAQEKLLNYDAVIDDCTKALEGNKKYTKAVIRRAKAYEHLGKYKEALRDFTAACLLEGFTKFETMQSAEQVLKSLSFELAQKKMAERSGKPIPLSKTFVDAYIGSFAEDPIMNSLFHGPNQNSHLTSNNHNGSGDVNLENNVTLNGDIAPSPNNPETLRGYKKAQNLLKAKKYDQIIDACTEEINTSHFGAPNYVEAILLRATFYLIAGSKDSAAKDFDQVFEVLKNSSPDDQYIKRVKANAYIKRGSLFMQQRELEKAMEDFEAAEKIDPDNADIYQHRGQMQVILGEFEKGLDDLAKSVKLRPDFGLAAGQHCYAKYRLAVATKNASILHLAMEEFRSVVDKFYQCAECFGLYGQALMEQENYDEAARMFDKALQLSPNNANICVHKGMMAVQASQAQNDESLKESITIIEKALEMDPYCEFAYEALGTTELQRGNVERALEIYVKAMEYARTDLELAHLYSLHEAALAQQEVQKEFGAGLLDMMKMF